MWPPWRVHRSRIATIKALLLRRSEYDHDDRSLSLYMWKDLANMYPLSDCHRYAPYALQPLVIILTQEYRWRYRCWSLRRFWCCPSVWRSCVSRHLLLDHWYHVALHLSGTRRAGCPVPRQRCLLHLYRPFHRSVMGFRHGLGLRHLLADHPPLRARGRLHHHPILEG